jgi:ketosteroid isomerase-like protein
MRSVVVILSILLCSAMLTAQDSNASLRSELEALHAKWFKAFYSGDGATMDQIEVDRLVLIMPTGFIWAKPKPRGSDQPKLDPRTERTLSDATVRRFGDTAILTGVVSTKSDKEKSQEATTVVFVQSSGKWKIASAQWSDVENKK